jgi:phosphoribosylanthranilate isomerase
MNVRVKICGITSIPDALAAVGAGADALGFMFHAPSPRAVTVAQAAAIIRELPPFVARVGVFVDAAPELLHETALATGIDTFQLHGEETPAQCEGLTLPVIKAFRVRDANSLTALLTYRTTAWLLDSYVPGQQGGTGARFNWDLAVQVVRLGRPVILAGGLTPENAAEAVHKVRPYGLDVSSGVESAPGRKDIARMRDFVAAAKGWRGR